MLSDLKLPVITYKKARWYTEGRTEPVRAFVNHRMVGYLAGTDAHFQTTTTPVSTHFGIGYGADGVVKISQYVPLDDTAYGNGNYDPSGNWDNWGYKTTEVNPQTISIEHQDHGDPAGKGVVSQKTQEASQKLQALLRYGTIAEWKAAGIVIRDWTNNAPILYAEIQKIPVDGKHIIMHWDIAGKLKPYCWRPWQADTIGFPRANYITAIAAFGVALRKPPAPADPLLYTQKQLDTAITAAIIAADAKCKTTTDALNAQILQLQKDIQLIKQDVKSKAITYIQSL